MCDEVKYEGAIGGYELVSSVGSCNFCNRRTDERVWAVGSRSANCSLRVRLCEACMAQLRETKIPKQFRVSKGRSI